MQNQLDPEKITYVKDKSGNDIPVPKDPGVIGNLLKLGLNVASKAVNLPLNDVQQQLDIPETTMGGDIAESLQGVGNFVRAKKYGLAESLADNPEERALRAKQAQAALAGEDPKAVATAPKKTNVGRTASPEEMVDEGSKQDQQINPNDPSNMSAERRVAVDRVGSSYDKVMGEWEKDIAAAQRDGERMGAVYTGMQKEMADAEMERRRVFQEGRELVQKGLSDYQNKANEIWQDAQSFKSRGQVANEYFARTGTAHRILASAALAFGNSSAMDQINKAIDGEMESQVARFNLKEKGLDASKTLLSEFRQIANSDNEAQLMAKKALIDYSRIALDGLIAKSNNREGIMRARQAQAQLAQQRMELDEKMAATRMELAMRSNLNPDTPLENVPEKDYESFVSGYGRMRNKESAAKFAEKIVDVESAIDASQSLMNIYEKTDPKDRAKIWSKNKAKADTIRTQLTGLLREPFTGPGALREEEYKRLVDAIGGNPTDFDLRGLNAAKLGTVNEILRKRAERTALAYGANPRFSQQFRSNRMAKGRKATLEESGFVKNE